MWLREERGMSKGVDLHWHRPLLPPSAGDHPIHGTAKSTSCKKGGIAEIEYLGNDKVLSCLISLAKRIAIAKSLVCANGHALGASNVCHHGPTYSTLDLNNIKFT